MITGTLSSSRALLLFCLYLFLGVGSSAFAGDASIRLQATLVWGTNDDKAKFPDLTEVNPDLKKKLRRYFKWKTYLQINKKVETVADGKEERIQMSPKCVVKIEHQGAADGNAQKIRVQLLGEGKRVIDHAQPIRPGQTLTLAGNDRNDTAWFVVVKRLEDVSK